MLDSAFIIILLLLDYMQDNHIEEIICALGHRNSQEARGISKRIPNNRTTFATTAVLVNILHLTLKNWLQGKYF